MASKSDLRVCVTVEGILRRLFSVSERPNGDLVVKLKTANNYRDFGASPQHDDSSIIVGQKYSVHRSLKSKERINALVHRMELADGSNISSSNYTKAIKQANQYAGLFAARAPDLSLDKYKAEPEERNFSSLIEFKASNNTFYYMVFVCGESPTLIDSNTDFDIKYFKFTHFHLAVVWSFAWIPSHFTGTKVHFKTTNPLHITNKQRAALELVLHGESRLTI